MKADIFKSVKTIWKPAISSSANEYVTKFDIDAQKKLLQIFSIGDYYWYVFDANKMVFEYFSDEVKSMLGYFPADITIPFFINNIHPDDLPVFMNFENRVVEFLNTLTPAQKLNYKVRYDYRVKKKDGDYMHIMHQAIAIQLDDNNKLHKILGVHTDISHIKKTIPSTLSFIGLNNEPSYFDVGVTEVFKSKNTSILSKREQQILEYLFEGKSSKVIGDILCISRETVDKHRSNMLNKTNSKNTVILIAKAIKTDWFKK